MTKKIIFSGLVLVAIAVVGIFLVFSQQNNKETTGSDINNFTNYVNDRFGFSVDYPMNIFTKKELSQNKDGIMLTSLAEEASLKIYGSHNVLDDSITNLIEQEKANFQTVEVSGKQDDAYLVGVDPTGKQLVEIIKIRDGDIFTLKLNYADGFLEQNVVEQITNSFVINKEQAAAGKSASWQQYSNSQFDFTFSYPEAAETQIEAGRVKLQLLGPDTVANSEVTDGFTLFIRTLKKSADQTLKELAESRYSEETSQRDGVTSPQSISLAGRKAFEFKVKSELGPVVIYHIIEGDESKVFDVSVAIADPESRGYMEQVKNIEKTLQLTSVDSTATFDEVSVAVLGQNYEGEPDRGCDKIEFIKRNVSKTTAPLNAALKELFSLDELWITENQYNFISKTNDTLAFEKATIEDGLANIYLTGELSGLAGVCDDPRATIQVEETALQFATVDQVQMYLNGKKVDTIR